MFDPYYKKTSDTYKNTTDAKCKYHNFKVSELVMVKLRRQQTQHKGNHKLKPKKVGHFLITHIINENAYMVDLTTEFHISHTFNIADIASYYPLDQAHVHIIELKMNSEKGGDASDAPNTPDDIDNHSLL